MADASDSDSEDWGFESLQAGQINGGLFDE